MTKQQQAKVLQFSVVKNLCTVERRGPPAFLYILNIKFFIFIYLSRLCQYTWVHRHTVTK